MQSSHILAATSVTLVPDAILRNSQSPNLAHLPLCNSMLSSNALYCFIVPNGSPCGLLLDLYESSESGGAQPPLRMSLRHIHCHLSCLVFKLWAPCQCLPFFSSSFISTDARWVSSESKYQKVKDYLEREGIFYFLFLGEPFLPATVIKTHRLDVDS